MKKIKYLFLILLLIVPFIAGCGKKKNDDDEIKIVSTIFPAYDFVREIIGEDSEIKNELLLSPGEEVHHFEPTPKDIINIKTCDLFIYVGGESDSWVEDILDSIGSDVRVVKMIDSAELVKEEIVEGMDSKSKKNDEYDEHVWTSPLNAMRIVERIYNEISQIDFENRDIYESNKNNYISKLEKLDREFMNIVVNSQRKELVFADRFPLRYFALRYNLNYYAAFPGCSDQTEASGKTISFLIDKVKKDKIPVIFTIELSNKKIAEAIADETSASILEFNSCHNISKKDFDKGVTYIDLMNRNKKVLKRALN